MKLVIVADIHGNHDALRALPEDYDGCCHGNHIRPREDVSRTSGSGRGNSSPRPEGFLSQDAERAAGCEMALDVEDPMESG
jgi:hypothetical protein